MLKLLTIVTSTHYIYISTTCSKSTVESTALSRSNTTPPTRYKPLDKVQGVSNKDQRYQQFNVTCLTSHWPNDVDN